MWSSQCCRPCGWLPLLPSQPWCNWSLHRCCWEAEAAAAAGGGIAPVLEYPSEEMDALPLMMMIRWMIHNHSAHEWPDIFLSTHLQDSIFYGIGYQGKSGWQFNTGERSIFNRPFRDLRRLSWEQQGRVQSVKNCRRVKRLHKELSNIWT
jgi:hypothetical protein